MHSLTLEIELLEERIAPTLCGGCPSFEVETNTQINVGPQTNTAVVLGDSKEIEQENEQENEA
jgi:hypothetical protein